MNTDDINFKDKFGNKVTITKLNDGNYRKTTQTNRDHEFEFLGDTYSYNLLSSSRTKKEYWENRHSERYLIEDKYNRLFYYRHDEEMNFKDGEDRVDILWTFVKDEEDSDSLANVSNLSLLREPYVAADETGWMAAHEYVDKNFSDKMGLSKKFKLQTIINFFKSL